MFKVGLGQDSHSFESDYKKELVLGGIIIPNHPGFKANSDGDVILHAITNAISSITGKRILGSVADELCQAGISDSSHYLKLALADLSEFKIEHLAISVEGASPKLSPYIDEIRINLAKLLSIKPDQLGITATTGENLTKFGLGLGLQALAILSVSKIT